MAYAGIRASTEGLALLRTMYDGEIRLKANEEGVVHPDIPRAQAEKIGDHLVVRIIPRVTVITNGTHPSTTGQLDPTALTFETGTTTSVSAYPIEKYAGVGIPINLVSKMLEAEGAQVKKKYRQQMRSALDASLDVQACNLALNLSTTRGPSNFDKSFLLDADQTLRTNAAEHYKDGTTVYLKYHTSQSKYLKSIAEIMNADARGKGSPNVSGILVEAWGINLAETGNVVFSAGNYWNLMFLQNAFAKGFNMEPTILAPQEYGLTTLMLAYMEAAFVEVFDEDALVCKSA